MTQREVWKEQLAEKVRITTGYDTKISNLHLLIESVHEITYIYPVNDETTILARRYKRDGSIEIKCVSWLSNSPTLTYKF